MRRIPDPRPLVLGVCVGIVSSCSGCASWSTRPEAASAPSSVAGQDSRVASGPEPSAQTQKATRLRSRSRSRLELHQSLRQEELSQEAQQALDRGEPAVAASLLERIAAESPKSAEAHHRLGKALESMGKLADAEREYRLALSLDGEYVDALASLGEIQASQGKGREALKFFDSAIEIAPKTVQAQLGRARCLEKLGRMDEAIASYCRALEIEPALAEAQEQVASIQIQRGQFDQALTRLNLALENTPNRFQARYLRGTVLMARGRYDEAIRDFEIAIALPESQSHPQVRQALAQANEKRSQHPVANEREESLLR